MPDARVSHTGVRPKADLDCGLNDSKVPICLPVPGTESDGDPGSVNTEQVLRGDLSSWGAALE